VTALRLSTNCCCSLQSSTAQRSENAAVDALKTIYEAEVANMLIKKLKQQQFWA